MRFTRRMLGVCQINVVITETPDGWLSLAADVVNVSGAPLPLTDAMPLSGASITAPTPLDRCYRHGQDMCGHARVDDAEGSFASHMTAGFTRRTGGPALLLGFSDARTAFADIAFTHKDGKVDAVSAIVRREGVALAPGERLALPALYIGAGLPLPELLAAYARKTGAVMNARTLPAGEPAMTGWCSWYYYFGLDTEEDTLNEVDILAASPLHDKLKVIQIDDGWNLPEPGHPRVWGDWHAGYKYPKGMRHLADNIKKAGFAPGLWLAPFSVEKASKLAKEHPEWLVQGDDGPADFWGSHGLDLTHPEALAFLRETFTRVFDEWGYDYIKIDFLIHGVQPGRRYDSSKTTAEVYRAGLSVIREAARDRFILCCGAPFGPSIGLCDGMRIGLDVSSRWFVPMNLGSWPLGNCNIVSAANQTLWRQWIHGAWWQNDPDCIVVRDCASDPEVKAFEKDFPATPEAPYGLSSEEAGCWARLVWFSGGMDLMSERVNELKEDRRALLDSCFPPNTQPVQWVDWYPNPDACLMRTLAGTLMLGMFNLGDEPVRMEVPAEKCGLESTWTFRERLSGETFSGEGDTVIFPILPAHGGRVWLLAG